MKGKVSFVWHGWKYVYVRVKLPNPKKPGTAVSVYKLIVEEELDQPGVRR
jgi:hypothetical protein